MKMSKRPCHVICSLNHENLSERVKHKAKRGGVVFLKWILGVLCVVYVERLMYRLVYHFPTGSTHTSLFLFL